MEPLRQPVSDDCPLLVGEVAFWSAGMLPCGEVGFCCEAGDVDVCGVDCCAEFWSPAVLLLLAAGCCCAAGSPCVAGCCANDIAPASSRAAVKLTVFLIDSSLETNQFLRSVHEWRSLFRNW